MNEQEVREFEENIVKGANIAFQRLVNQKKNCLLYTSDAADE